MAIEKKYWQMAMDSQSACNLSGLVFALPKVMQAICDDVNSGTHERNTHPIVVLFVTQLAHLSGVAAIADSDVYNKAYDACLQALRVEE